MKRLITLLSALALSLGLLTGCGSSGAATAEPPQPAELAQELLDSEGFTDILSEVSAKVAAMLYGVSSDSVAECAVYCSTGATAEEIAVFKAADAEAAEALVSGAQERIAGQALAYAEYAPAEVAKLENAEVRSSGLYVVCVISDNSAATGEILDKYFA
ncbi:MAG: DUF4358 domain-containing protein [Oscillospiraceae bacterium]|nr:DUF4358 domain-containing protein [Oscillospiraceae bacterium]